MFDADPSSTARGQVIVIGAGIGGLATALRLQSVGYQVTVLDQHGWVGGKMRAVASEAGPVDAGPTVLTMRHVFDDLFEQAGSKLSDHVRLVREPCLARHFWPDGSTLDLFDEPGRNAAAIEAFAGAEARRDFEAFDAEAQTLYHMFDAPMMRAAEPKLADLARAALQKPALLPSLSPFATLAGKLRRAFRDPRLAQLFARYATYVGGLPHRAPALLSLIWHAEARGVWRVEGGMHRLAEAVADRFQALGGTVLLQSDAVEIVLDAGTCSGVLLENGRVLRASQIVFAGDPRALAAGRLGAALRPVAPQTLRHKRSLSARVWSFAATPQTDLDLAHHNVFFGETPGAEFADLDQGRMPEDPTLYVCAEDRGHGAPRPDGPERFEIILNAAPLRDGQTTTEDEGGALCHQVTFQTLARFGLKFDPEPMDSAALTTPPMFDRLFPGSAGSLYGQTPHGTTAALQRPRARTTIKGLYLAGGATHPGAGVPMAALSGKHAAEAILKDHVSI